MNKFVRASVVCLSVVGGGVAWAQDGSTTAAVKQNAVLERALREWPEGKVSTTKHPGEWGYEEGVLLDGMIAEWRQTGDGRLFSYTKAAVDRAVGKDGTVTLDGTKAFPVDGHSLDDVEMGRSVVAMYRVTQDKRYYVAAKFLHDQVQAQPRNASGGYWHKQVYPNQMWLDGAFMAEPFMANYARTFGRDEELGEVANQLLLMDGKMRVQGSGLLRHGWDESGKMEWSKNSRHLSPEVWARAMGWYAMALVDVVERLPDTDPQRASLVGVTQRTLLNAMKYQDAQTGLWWQVMDKGPMDGEPAAKGNFPESSASCMFVYAIAKAVRLGVMPTSAGKAAERGWAGVQKAFVKDGGTLTGTVQSAGLGGTPYRSGTYEYYIGEKVVENDAKGVGAYLMADSEMLQRARVGALAAKGRGRTVLFDAHFNAQKRKTADGRDELFHYKYGDDANSGYSFFARMFQQYGLRTESLTAAPTAADLKSASIYVITSPDIPALNPQPHYMDKASAEAIEEWVRAGGVLVLMENDSEHADQDHFNVLSDRFGMHFNAVTRNRQEGASYANTIVPIAAGAGGIFTAEHKALEKETCTLTLSKGAKAIVTDKGDVMMATARLGKGWVFANVDPWVYNEYTDGRKTPMDEDNFAGGQELVRWLVGRLPEREAVGRRGAAAQ